MLNRQITKLNVLPMFLCLQYAVYERDGSIGHIHCTSMYMTLYMYLVLILLINCSGRVAFWHMQAVHV